MARKPPGPLRTGFTTGACATAAAAAATEALLGGAWPDPVRIRLPRGQEPAFPLHDRLAEPGAATATVRKDAGDDPDVTHGALIRARVSRGAAGQGVRFHAGEGVGIVTRPGLPVPVGEPAINPVPRRMMTETLEGIARDHAVAADFDVTISVPGGAELALQTWNPRLGIEGGISILGTTGIVRPFSCAAWIASIHRGVDVARAGGLSHVAGSTGATSERAAQEMLGLPDHAMLDMGDFAGGLLKYLARHPVAQLTIAGGMGKLTKLAQGALDLHSARSQVDFAQLGEWAAGLGLDGGRIARANTVLEAFEIARAADPAGADRLAGEIVARARDTARAALGDAPVAPRVIGFDREGGLLADSDV
ncbi:cobalt-precorrin-5B (C(1))-methyltransferase [Brevirhabdus pacifica]|uniref:Cobalt-precorrin-5B C(1)-methyltransferase n=2 Tax=Brevirhabdus pacifica TaxID=1267768 RepID=A0A1U7DKU2_9RHOB|nr:cobalt-precorrin-5B (C(1))-methyltransferase [Brevirhabdus pacifica]APX90513.1 cobalt-precorrin-5B (C(1))-methyltransferase [Brevirhabdus pacifica]OWU78478.1 cobalt-precorrin-6A synthase [Loktanella sp. 22II-4b]